MTKEKKRRIIVLSLPIFYREDFRAEGFSLYKGILIQWDVDYDERILGFIDHLCEENLLVAGEHEGGLSLLWDNQIPEGYEEGKQVDVEDDCWSIVESKAVEGLEEVN